MRVTYISSLLFFLFFSFSVFSQQRYQINGRITDLVSGAALEAATVSIPDLKKGTASDKNGFYKLDNIPAGRYLIEVTHLGYSPIIQTIELNGGLKYDFQMQPSVIENENVTVTGVSSATSTKKTPIPVTIVKKEDLFRNISTNLIDNLSHLPGVSQISTGPAISKPSIRGLGYNRVVVVNDGLRQEGQQWGDEHGIEIDEQQASRVEVLKGPASLMYGSDALAGVINIISVNPVHEGRLNGEISSAYLTNNRQRNLHAALDGNSNGFIWGINGSYKAAADYRNRYDGYVFNSKFNEKNGSAYVGLNRGWGYSHFFLSSFDQTVGLVEGDRDAATGDFLKLIDDNGMESETIPTNDDFISAHPYVPRQRIRHFRIGTDNSFQVGANRFRVIAGFQRNQRQEFGNVLDPQEKELWFDLGTFNYNLQYQFTERGRWKTTLGLNGMAQRNTNKGEEELIPDYGLFDLGLFLYTQKRWDRLTLSGGIRFDNRSLDTKPLNEGSEIKFSGFDRNFSNLSGSAGLAYQAGKELTLKFNLARGFRAPGIPELSSNGAHEGTNRFEFGDEALQSETSWQADAGVEISSEHVSFSSSIFYNGIDNFIYYRKLSSVNGGDSLIVDGSDSYFAFRFDQSKAFLYGAEFNLDIHPHPLDWLHIENTFSWVRGRLASPEDGSRNLSFIPAPRLISEIKVDFLKKGNTLKNGYARLEWDHNFPQNHPFTGYNTETATPGYSLVSAGLGADIMGRSGKLASLVLGVNNLFDQAYQNHLSRLKYTAENPVTGRTGVFGMGRNFSVKMNIPLVFLFNSMK